MTKQALSIKSNAVEFAKVLKKRKDALPKVASQTVNTGAKFIEREYKKELRKFTLRNKFTMGAVKIFLSRPQSSKGGFRELSDINAIVGVKKMKGGKEHYLNKQETGDRKRGRSKTLGGVPIPLDAARAGGSHKRPISGPLRLNKISSLPVLKIGGKRGKVENLGYNDRFNAKGGKQRWAILHKYKKTNPYNWDLAKQFVFTGLKSGLGLFKKKGQRIKMIRTLDYKTVKIKARHKFEKSFKQLTPKLMDTIFKRAAIRFIKGK